MSKFTFVVEAVKSNKTFEALTPGQYSGVIKEARDTTIRSGRHAGKKSVDVAVQMEDGRYIWKVLPLFTAAYWKKLSEADKKWYEMSTISFQEVVELGQNADISDCIGKSVKVLVGVHQANGYGVQNSIVKFIK